MKRLILLFPSVIVLTAQAKVAVPNAQTEFNEIIPGSDDELSAEMVNNIHTSDVWDKEEQAKVQKQTEEKKKAPEKATSEEIDIIISKVGDTKLLFKQLADKKTLPLRDRAVCRTLFSAYANLEQYMLAMKKPMKDLEWLLAFVSENIGNIYFFYSPKFTAGISNATEEKIKEAKYQYIDTGKHQGILLELVENIVKVALNAIEQDKTKNVIKSIFDYKF